MNHTTTIRDNLPLPTDFDHEAYLCGFNLLTDPEIQYLLDHSEIKTYPKGHILLRPGKISPVCYGNLKGCVREYQLDDGEERTTEFYTEGASLTVAELNRETHLPSQHYWECLEPTTLSLFPHEAEEEMFRRFPRLERMCRIETEAQLVNLRQKMYLNLHATPGERYLHLLNTRPDLLNRAPQYQLASYIGVKPETLSRIRARMRSSTLA